MHVNGVRYVTTGATFTVDDNPGSESDLRVGQVVRIEGRIEQDGINGTATRVIFDDEVEGPVQDIDLAGVRLVVLGRTVQVGTQTSFDDSIVPRSLEGLEVGDRVEVSGRVASTGVVEATRIELKSAQGSVEVKGTVAGIDSGNRRFTLGLLTVSYATAQLEGFASGQPANGDRVEAFGSLDGAGVLVATRIEQEGSDDAGGTDESGNYEGLVDRFVIRDRFQRRRPARHHDGHDRVRGRHGGRARPGRGGRGRRPVQRHWRAGREQGAVPSRQRHRVFAGGSTRSTWPVTRWWCLA